MRCEPGMPMSKVARVRPADAAICARLASEVWAPFRHHNARRQDVRLSKILNIRLIVRL